MREEKIVLHANRHLHFNWPGHRDHLPDRKAHQRFNVFAAGVILTVASLALFSSSQASGDRIQSQDTSSAIPKQDSRALPDLNSPDAKNQMVEYYARDLYNSGHVGTAGSASAPADVSSSTQELLQSLQAGQSAERRASAIKALTAGPPTVVPVLLDALSDPDPGIRRGAAEILGARHAPEAEDSLFFATDDADPGVRSAAVKALGELGAVYALPRIEWLQVTEIDGDAQLAARLAQKQVYAQIAAALGVSPGDLRVIAIAAADQRIYAATKSELYSPSGSGWRRVGFLPDTPTALAAAGDDGSVLYLGTASSGVFRSLDGGLTWKAVNRSLPAATPFSVTALTINPANDRQVYIALAADSGTTPLAPFGLFESSDAGDSWTPVAQWNVDDITIRLVIDPTEPARLLGLTDAGTWQFPLSKSNATKP